MIKPLISILMPYKNTARFLEACLDSIIDQGYIHWELLAVDDHSKDHSTDILQEYAGREPRIKLSLNSGKGIIPALRTAYAMSSGEFITRMDSDDIMYPDKLQCLLSGLQSHGKGHVAVGKVKYFSDRGISDGYARYESWINALTEQGENYKEIYKECVIPSPCWMISREDLDASGAFVSNRYPEDYDLTFRFYEQGLKCIPCSETLHMWRDYDSRTSRTSEHYAQNYFLQIKLHYFLKLDYDRSRPLVIWGAGYKGKTLAKGLKEQGVPFTWLCDNPNKIGKRIYDQSLIHYTQLAGLENPQSIISVANASAQEDIRQYLGQLNLNNTGDAFFFC
ncbi:MAG: glycosyltransferase family 2 protein [Eudoraea sp.]|nr:glycosyltransferase [Eudoraea sp.]NNJ40701.1 glycosyltransferase family 2 protein [Eudoraea sp.]